MQYISYWLLTLYAYQLVWCRLSFFDNEHYTSRNMILKKFNELIYSIILVVITNWFTTFLCIQRTRPLTTTYTIDAVSIMFYLIFSDASQVGRYYCCQTMSQPEIKTCIPLYSIVEIYFYNFNGIFNRSINTLLHHSTWNLYLLCNFHWFAFYEQKISI